MNIKSTVIILLLFTTLTTSSFSQISTDWRFDMLALSDGSNRGLVKDNEIKVDSKGNG